jgi:hypothetical protein
MPGRLWKLKHFPTIDFLVMRAFDDVYELLLRGSATCVQSLHCFQDRRKHITYRLPVLIRPTPSQMVLDDGDAVELTVRSDRTADGMAVSFPLRRVPTTGEPSAPDHPGEGARKGGQLRSGSHGHRRQCPHG